MEYRQREFHNLDGMVMTKRAYVETSIGQVHYRHAGPAVARELPPLLLFHMSPASSVVYDRFIEVLGTNRSCFAIDTPGYGNSDAPDSPPRIEDYASVMVEVAENLGLPGPIDIMGYHTGSMTAVQMAVAAPRLVRRLVLVSAPIFTADEVERFHSIYSTEPLWTVDGERLLSLWKWFVEFFQVGSVNTVEDAGRIFYERLSGRDKYWWGHSAAFKFDFAAALSAVDQRILILNPNDDLVAMTPRAEDIMRNGRIENLPDMTHGFLDKHPEEIAALVADFLDE